MHWFVAPVLPPPRFLIDLDGIANVGLGNLENYSMATADSHPAPAFYADAASAALQRVCLLLCPIVQTLKINVRVFP